MLSKLDTLDMGAPISRTLGNKRRVRHSGTCVAIACYAAASVGLTVGLLAGSGRATAAPSEITIPGDHVFPESITATSDGTLIIGSLGQGSIYRAAPGASTAKLWIKPGTAGMMSVLGVLADERSGTLWACSSDLSAAGVVIRGGQKPVALKSFDLRSGAPKGSVPLPGGRTLCNDIAIGPDGSAYVVQSACVAVEAGCRSIRDMGHRSPLHGC